MAGIRSLTRQQKQPLFDLFELNDRPDEAETDELAKNLWISGRKVRKWFANRRGDLKRRRHEERVKEKTRKSIAEDAVKALKQEADDVGNISKREILDRIASMDLEKEQVGGRSAMKKTVRDVVEDLRRAAPKQRDFIADDDVILK